MDNIFFSARCDFCMYREGCLGPLPGDHLGCLAFAVSKEDAPAYENFLTEQSRKKARDRALFISSLAEA